MVRFSLLLRRRSCDDGWQSCWYGGHLRFRARYKHRPPIKLSTLQVQLWPEYDQPSMLVIYDFRVPDSLKLPVSVSLNLPKDAHLVAVASQAADSSLLKT